MKSKKTKEEFYNLMDFFRNIIETESILFEYDVDYSCIKDFGNDFYKYLEENHLITTEQKAIMLGQLRDSSLCLIDEFMDIMVKDYNEDYEDIATIYIKQFESIICAFFEKNQELGNSLIKAITEEHEFKWDYLFKLVPNIPYEEPPIQNSECFISLKDVEFLKNATESLESMVEENDKVTKDILTSMKKILDKIK